VTKETKRLDITQDVITGSSLPAEMTGAEEITNGTVHIHAVMAIEGDQAVAGHLHCTVPSAHVLNGHPVTGGIRLASSALSAAWRGTLS
jgi:hypothetical protein